MAERYAVTESGNWTGAIIPRPGSYANTSFSADADDDTFRSFGLWPVVVSDPGSPGEWYVPAGRATTTNSTTQTVTETISYELMPLDQRKKAMQSRAESQRAMVLATGFSFDGAMFSIIDQTRRQRLLELVAQVGAFRNGDANNALPNGRSSVQFFDNTGAAHDFNAAQVVQFGETGNELVQDADDRLGQLIGQIQAAASHNDLDAVDITTGWPN